MNRRTLLGYLLATPLALSMEELWLPQPQLLVVESRDPLTIAELDETLRTIYLPQMREMFNNQSVLLHMLEQTNRGNYAIQ